MSEFGSGAEDISEKEFTNLCTELRGRVTSVLFTHGLLRREKSQGANEEYHQQQFAQEWAEIKAELERLVAMYKSHPNFIGDTAYRFLGDVYSSVYKHEIPLDKSLGNLVAQYRGQKDKIEQQFAELMQEPESTEID